MKEGLHGREKERIIKLKKKSPFLEPGLLGKMADSHSGVWKVQSNLKIVAML